MSETLTSTIEHLKTDINILAQEPQMPNYKWPVEVKPAGNKGRGVFATRNIKRGEVCCFYDGIKIKGRDLAFGTMVTGTHGYLQDLASGDLLCGFTDQFRPGGCAQLCNDASTKYKVNDLKYHKDINVAECIVDDGCMVFVARKRIKKGQELLYSYGEDYWRQKHSRKSDNIFDIVNIYDHLEPEVCKMYTDSLKINNIDAYLERFVLLYALFHPHIIPNIMRK